MLILKTVNTDFSAYEGFQYPREIGARVEALDWSPRSKCGGGLHGLLYGWGDWSFIIPECPCLVLDTCDAEVVPINEEKVKISHGILVHIGTCETAARYCAERQPPNFKPTGFRKWYRDGKLHREDGPAIEHADGTCKWYQHGECHRDNGPAIEYVDGIRAWYRRDKLHREDGPAIEHMSGTREWWLNDKLHRDDGPAIEHVDGTRKWYQHDKLHREDGPAVEYADGNCEWWRDGLRHR